MSNTGEQLRVCSTCNMSHLWTDDTHSVCFRCRTKKHNSGSCEECSSIGLVSSAKWADFVAAKPRYVSFNDFEALQNKMASMMKANADFLQQMASSGLSGTQASSWAEK